jgi:hypothetical protein
MKGKLITTYAGEYSTAYITVQEKTTNNIPYSVWMDIN